MKFKAGDIVGGRFRILDSLGQGGVGIVYRVEDNQRQEQVALKILKPEIAKNRLAMERFMREVQVMRSIVHDGIVQVHDTGRIADSLFYTMTCVQGESIKSYINREKHVDLGISIMIMNEVCSVLEKIHTVAIHRDLSSDNVMIQEDGSICILDFGTARLVEGESDLTVAGVHLGKMCYSSPEQHTDSSTIDERSDLYSMGVLFYEMLTNTLVMGYEPVTNHRPELGDHFNAFFEKALAQDREDRFSTVGEFQEAINALATG